MPDTAANQLQWPQNSNQKPGCGFPCHWRSENPVNSASLKTGYGAAIFSSPT
jgi:hypothetical protein